MMPKNMKSGLVLAAALTLVSVNAHAIDNPDSEQGLARFEQQCSAFENRLQNEAKNDTELFKLYVAYEKFLDAELNKAYRKVLGHLTDKSRASLVASQKVWLKYRDAEYQFVDDNWTNANFGSSSTLTRHASKSLLIKQRALMLLTYAENY